MKEYCKILIVDDELIMRQGIAHMIDWEKEGFQIIGQASNGQEAIDFIKNSPPHIVITDVVMPKIDGVELIHFLQTNYSNIKIIVLSSYSDFDYVKSSFQYGAVDYILKPSLNIDELLRTLKKAASKIKDLSLTYDENIKEENILSRALLGFDSNIDFDSLNNIFVNDCFYLFGSNIKGLGYDYKTKDDLASYILSGLAIDCSNETIIKNIQVNNEIIIYIINFKKEYCNSLNDSFIKISAELSKKFLKAFFIVSKIFFSINDLKHIFENDFLNLAEQSFYYKNSSLIISDKLQISESIEKFDFKHFSELTSKLEIQNSLDMLTSYITTAISKKSLSKFELKTLIQNCFYNIISTLETLEFNLEKLQSLKYKCFNTIEQAMYSENLLLNYNELLEDFSRIIDECQNRISSHIVNKIIQYINEHYADQLTLADVSKLFNFNYYYLSSYFSNHNKEGFNEFLNKIRIEKACDFLKQDIPISDISSMVGYSDHSYFCKVFKKFTGITPSKFRKNSIKVVL